LRSRFPWDKNSVDCLFKDTANQKFTLALLNDFLLAITLLPANAVHDKLANPAGSITKNRNTLKSGADFFLKKGHI
jgi:hypothetical protein